MLRSGIFICALILSLALVACGTPATTVPPTPPPAPTSTLAPSANTIAPTRPAATIVPATAASVQSTATNVPPTATLTRVLPTATKAAPSSVVIEASCPTGPASCAWNPKSITIRVGTVVIWKSNQLRHEIVTDDWDAPNPGPNTIVGGKEWQFDAGQQVQFTFNAAGTVQYFCGFHGKAMSAAIVVTP